MLRPAHAELASLQADWTRTSPRPIATDALGNPHEGGRRGCVRRLECGTTRRPHVRKSIGTSDAGGVAREEATWRSGPAIASRRAGASDESVVRDMYRGRVSQIDDVVNRAIRGVDAPLCSRQLGERGALRRRAVPLEE
jgi:hypothetical protein